MSECNYNEVNPTRLIGGALFPNGVIEYPFSVGAPNAWIPSKSYFRISLSVYGIPITNPPPPQAVAPLPSEMVAFADNAVGNLFDNCYLRSNNVAISSITQGFAQASALKVRLGKSYANLKSMGAGAEMNEARFTKRVQDISQFARPDSGIDSVNEFYKPTEVGHFIDATVAIDVGTDPHEVVGTDTLFETGMPSIDGDPLGGPINPGDLLTISGIQYPVLAVDDDQHLRIGVPATEDTTTSDWYIERKDTVRGPQAYNTVYATFQPPLGIFDHPLPIGGGQFRLTLNPNANYLLNGVETRNPEFKAGIDGLDPASTYSLVVNECKFYAYIEKMAIPDQVQDIKLNECLVQQKQWQNNLQFSVPPSTTALTIFVQDPSAGRSPLVPPSMFKMLDNSDLKLQTVQITFGGITMPSTAWQSAWLPDYNFGGVNQLQQRYRDSYEESGLDVNGGGVESYPSYLLRGPIYHYSFARDMSKRSTEVQVNTQFNQLPAGPGNGRGLVFCVAWYRREVQITTALGLLTNVVARQV